MADPIQIHPQDVNRSLSAYDALLALKTAQFPIEVRIGGKTHKSVLPSSVTAVTDDGAILSLLVCLGEAK